MSAYKNFTLNNPGGPPSWSGIEKQAFEDIIDTILLDACLQTKQTTNGHRHYRLYYSGGGTVAATVDASGNLGIGVAAASAITEIRGATEQLRLSFDGTDRLSFTVDTNGNTTLAPSGTSVWMAADKKFGVGGTAANPFGFMEWQTSPAELSIEANTGFETHVRIKANSGQVILNPDESITGKGITFVGKDYAGTTFAHTASNKYLYIDASGHVLVGGEV